jgi:hypothetical protein
MSQIKNSTSLYEQDILLWLEDTVAKLKARDFDEAQRQQYRGRQGGSLAKELTQSCSDQIADLLRQGYY